jgi:putative spermidine/putrescine transport system permease protein
MIRFLKHRLGWLGVMAAPGSIILALFFLLPLGVISLEAFSEGGGGFSRLFSDRLFWRGLVGSAGLSLFAAGTSVAVGFAVSLRLARMAEALRTMLTFLISLPLTFSGLIVAYGFILTFGRAGFITLILAKVGVDPANFAGFIYSPTGLGFAYCYYLIPRVVLILLPVLLNFDEDQLRAAESLGAGRLRAIWDILIPEVFPTAVVAFCLVAAVAFGAYGTALALVGTQVNILPLLLYSKISGVTADFPAAAAMSLVLLAICTSIMAIGETVAARREKVVRHG